jgi:HlyD family secretion protein
MTGRVAKILTSGEGPRPFRRMLWLFVATVLVVAATAYVVWFFAAPEPTLVMVTSPAFQDLESSVSSSGRVVPEHEFTARANFPGLIESIEVQLGQNVRAGELLVRMRDPYAASRVASATAALEATEVTNENVQKGGTQEERLTLQTDLRHAETERLAAQGNLATLKDLQASGAASEAEVTAATHRAEAAEQTLQFVRDRIAHRFSKRDVASWNSKVADAQAGLAAAKASFTNVNITSTIAGTVYLLPIKENDFVSPGAELMRVADLQRLEVHANFDEADMGKLHNGAAVLITWEGKPGRIWHGIIKHSPFAAVMAGVRSVGECIITISDVKSDLPPNTIVNATVTSDQRRHVLTLPREALRTEGNASFVYKLSQGALVRTPVQVGLMNLDHFEIIRGIGPSDSVALHAFDNREFFDGLRVKARP